MGAAWRGPTQVGKGQWQRVLEMVGKIRALNMEVRPNPKRNAMQCNTMRCQARPPRTHRARMRMRPSRHL